jgi:arylsulfatase A-like enzyme
MYPTLVELCGLPRPAGIEGHSLARLLKDPKASWDFPAYSVVQTQNGKIGKSVRTARWHYAEWTGGQDGAMLTDIENDPHELKNLADDPKYAQTVKEMKALLQKMP